MLKNIKKNGVQMMKKYKSVKSMINDLVENKKERIRKINKLGQRQIVKVLKAFRLKNKLTQDAISKKIGCDQSAISKLEKSIDDDITIGELKRYLLSLDMGLGIAVREKTESINRVELIKYHVRKIETYVTELEDIAEDDEDIRIGVYEAYLSQIKGLLDDFGKKFKSFRSGIEKKYNKKIAKGKKEQIHISLPYDVVNECHETIKT